MDELHQVFWCKKIIARGERVFVYLSFSVLAFIEIFERNLSVFCQTFKRGNRIGFFFFGKQRIFLLCVCFLSFLNIIDSDIGHDVIVAVSCFQ